MAIQKRVLKGCTTWRVQVYHKRRVVADASFDTKKEATHFETEVKAKLQAGTFVNTASADTLTLADALDKYLKTVSIHKKGEALRRETSQTKYIKKYPVSNLPMSKIKSADIALFRDQRSSDVGVNSVRLNLALISHLYTTAIQEWNMDYLNNPVTSIRKPRVSGTSRERRLESGEFEKLMNSAEILGGNIGLVVSFAAETAMRRGEIASILVKDFDAKKGVAFLADTKNNTSRTVFLTKKAQVILKEVTEGKARNESAFNMVSDHIGKAFIKLCRRAKSLDNSDVNEPIQDLRFHDLRHEATSRLFEKGLSTEEVMSITGHKTYQMLKRYTHLRNTDLHTKLG